VAHYQHHSVGLETVRLFMKRDYSFPTFFHWSYATKPIRASITDYQKAICTRMVSFSGSRLAVHVNILDDHDC